MARRREDLGGQEERSEGRKKDRGQGGKEDRRGVSGLGAPRDRQSTTKEIVLPIFRGAPGENAAVSRFRASVAQPLVVGAGDGACTSARTTRADRAKGAC